MITKRPLRSLERPQEPNHNNPVIEGIMAETNQTTAAIFTEPDSEREK